MTVARKVAVLLVLSVGLTACGSSGPSTSASSSAVTSNQIVVSELSDPVGGLSAYDIVQRYQSHWLQKRGPTSINNPVPIQVYLDGTGSPYGSVEVLRRIRAADVASITHFDANEAQFRFGLDNVAGAILVRTKSGRNDS